MSEQERADLVELLRCAHYLGTLFFASDWLDLRYLEEAAHFAARKVMREWDLTITHWPLACLEAAQRIEDEEWP